jgi:peptidoglycan glycosyltransferase
MQLRTRREQILLLLAALFLFVNWLSLQLQDDQFLPIWSLYGGWLICVILGSLFLNRTVPERDPYIFPIIMFISGWGILLIDRLAPAFSERQTSWLMISVAAMIIVSASNLLLRWLRMYRYILLLSGILLLFSTIILGSNPSGVAGAPELWLGIGNIFFQPSEALKVILAAFLASYFAEQYPLLRAQEKLRQFDTRYPILSPRILGPIILMWMLAVIVVIWQRDLGTAAIFFAVFLILLYVTSGQIMILLGGGLLLAIAGVVAYNRFAVVQLRVDIWINPWTEADGRAYQIVQSLMAFGQGGIIGQGIGQGSPTYIPVVHSDFIFAALAEEFGLLGVIALLACIAILVFRGFNIAIALQNRPFYALFSIGLSTLICVQTILITGGALKLLPLTGVTFPFLSYGGSSLITCFIMCGFLIRLSAETQ